MLRKAKHAVVVVAAIAAVVAYGNTGTVTATLEDGAFNVSFASHAHETNSLWVVYGPGDSGTGTNGWAHVERLGTVTPETDAWTYPAPAGWGETVKAIRFILSEVPYDYDYSLDFIRSKSRERLVLGDFDFYMNYRLGMQTKVYFLASNNGSFFTNRDGVSATPYFNLFAIAGKNWRFDYNATTGGQVSGVSTNEFYLIEASSAGLYVNGSKVNSMKGTASMAQSQGRLEFFWGGTAATSGSNNGHHISLYGAQIYDAPTGGNLLVNLVPMVKDGRPGMYDTVRNVYYYSDTGTDFDLAYGPSRVESANPFFADALVKVLATGPEIFMPGTPMTVSESITNTYGGILDGTATLTLTGENDWGGAFTVSNGTLAAAFGQGLGSNDCLRLATESTALGGTYGGYGGWNGRATASPGSGAGQIFVPDTGYNYLAYCAADGGELEVDIGGAGAQWTPVGNYRRLLLNGAAGAGTLRFRNPILLTDDHLIVRVGYGTAIFEENIQSAQAGANARTLSAYDLEKGSFDGTGILHGTDNRFYNFNVYSGAWVMDANTTNTVHGTLETKTGAAATLLATNAVVQITGEGGGGGWLHVYGGKATFAGGSLAAGGFLVGESGESQPAAEVRRPGLTFSGKVRLNGLNGKSYGSGTINSAATSYALVLEEGADVEMYNLTFLRRQVIHRGGSLKLKGGYGILNMGKEGTARYMLHAGAELTAVGIGQDGQDANDVNNGTAQFVFCGGTLGTTSRTPEYPVYFRDFNQNSSIFVASAYGGEFRVDHSTSITNGMKTSPSSLGTSTAWNYAAVDWLTASAFKKTGSKTLTMSGTNTYACATDVAAGTLLLAGGENPGVLPTNGVTRVTGGTLDLGGNVQTVRALVGTAGSVVNGTIVAKEGIYPGGAGAVGSFACGAALEGTLSIDVDATGACDQIVAQGTLDVSNIDLVMPTSLPAGVIKLQVVAGATTGTFRSVENLPQGWAIMPSPTGLWVRKIVGTTILFR